MTAPRIELELLGERQVVGDLLDVADRAADAFEWFTMLARFLEAEFDRNFARRGAVLGERWKPLSWKYMGQKIADGYGNKGILEREGELRKSLTTPGGAAVRFATSKQLIFGTTVPYARVHQRGNWMMNLPARPMIGIPRQRNMGRRIASSYGLFLKTGEARWPSRVGVSGV